MEIEKSHFWGTSGWAPISLEQFQKITEFNINTSPFPCHTGSTFPTFRDMYLKLAVRKKIYLYVFVKIHHIYVYIKYIKNGNSMETLSPEKAIFPVRKFGR